MVYGMRVFRVLWANKIKGPKTVTSKNSHFSEKTYFFCIENDRNY